MGDICAQGAEWSRYNRRESNRFPRRGSWGPAPDLFLKYKYRNPRYPEDITGCPFINWDPLFHPQLSDENTKLFAERLTVSFSFFKKKAYPSLISVFPGIEDLLMKRPPMMEVFKFIRDSMERKEFWEEISKLGELRQNYKPNWRYHGWYSLPGPELPLWPALWEFNVKIWFETPKAQDWGCG